MITKTSNTTYSCDFCNKTSSTSSASAPSGWIQFSSTRPMGANGRRRIVPAIYCVCPTCVASSDPNIVSKIKAAACGNPS
jgi:hypothetical protein